MAEETVKRVTGLNPLFQAISEMSTIGIPSFSGSPFDASADASVPEQDYSKQHHYNHASSSNHLIAQDCSFQQQRVRQQHQLRLTRLEEEFLCRE